ncbi:MAG: hypothetical protein K1000chlam2_00243 [Chlamydiae bacterium]|nr:hypothetical protein [Chlamydiota bacterium]
MDLSIGMLYNAPIMWWKSLIFILFFQCAVFSSETVFCLHGFMRKPASMKKIATAFKSDGYAVENWGYPSRDKTIQEHAQALVKDLNKIAKKNPGEPIHFVTHSLGGIIVRCALNHPDCPEEAKIGKAVLLAPPNQGAEFGRFLGHVAPARKALGVKAGRQILYSENFDYVGQFPETKEVLVISGTFGWNPLAKGKNDGKVGVEESCLSTPHKHMTHFSGHSWIMYSDTVIYNAVRFVAK